MGLPPGPGIARAVEVTSRRPAHTDLLVGAATRDGGATGTAVVGVDVVGAGGGSGTGAAGDVVVGAGSDTEVVPVTSSASATPGMAMTSVAARAAGRAILCTSPRYPHGRAPPRKSVPRGPRDVAGIINSMRKLIIPITVVALAATASVAAAWTGARPIGGTWNGTARSVTDTSVTFTVHGNISIGADGRPSGRADLGAPLNCSVRWTPVRQTAGVTTFRETVTATRSTLCEDGGRVNLSRAADGTLRYRWTNGDLASIAYLDGISGHWRGVGRTAAGGRVTTDLIVRGTVWGGIEGSVGYGPPLTCSGYWVPRSGNTPGWRRFTEVITQSHTTACVGIGTASVAIRTDGRLQYRWTGGGYVTTAVLNRVAG